MSTAALGNYGTPVGQADPDAYRIQVAFGVLQHLGNIETDTVIINAGECQVLRDGRDLDAAELRTKDAALERLRAFLAGEPVHGESAYHAPPVTSLDRFPPDPCLKPVVTDCPITADGDETP